MAVLLIRNIPWQQHQEYGQAWNTCWIAWEKQAMFVVPLRHSWWQLTFRFAVIMRFIVLWHCSYSNNIICTATRRLHSDIVSLYTTPHTLLTRPITQFLFHYNFLKLHDQLPKCNWQLLPELTESFYGVFVTRLRSEPTKHKNGNIDEQTSSLYNPKYKTQSSALSQCDFCCDRSLTVATGTDHSMIIWSLIKFNRTAWFSALCLSNFRRISMVCSYCESACWLFRRLTAYWPCWCRCIVHLNHVAQIRRPYCHLEWQFNSVSLTISL